MKNQTTNQANGASTAQTEMNELQKSLFEKISADAKQRELGERLYILNNAQSAIGGADLHQEDTVIVFEEMREWNSILYDIYTLVGRKEALYA